MNFGFAGVCCGGAGVLAGVRTTGLGFVFPWFFAERLRGIACFVFVLTRSFHWFRKGLRLCGGGKVVVFFFIGFAYKLGGKRLGVCFWLLYFLPSSRGGLRFSGVFGE